MYHIKNDLRALKSAEQLYHGLSLCMENQAFETLTVATLSKKAGVGRATFYRNFDDITDILLWKCDCRFSEMFHSLSVRDILQAENQNFILYALKYWEQNPAVVEQLLSIRRSDIIFEAFVKNSNIISEYRRKLGMPVIEDFDYYISARAGLFIGIMSTWIKNGKIKSIAELNSILSSQLQNLT